MGYRTISDPEITTRVGRNMRLVRKKRGIKVRDVIQFLGASHPQVLYNWERGRNETTYYGLLKLAVLYQCSLDDFFEEDPNAVLNSKRRPVGKNQYKPAGGNVRLADIALADKPRSVHEKFGFNPDDNSVRGSTSEESGTDREGGRSESNEPIAQIH